VVSVNVGSTPTISTGSMGSFSPFIDTINTHKLKQPIVTQHTRDVITNVIGVKIKTTVNIQLIQHASFNLSYIDVFGSSEEFIVNKINTLSLDVFCIGIKLVRCHNLL
jgi:hypothetical protein